MPSDYSQIRPDHFFSCAEEKTRFNWFAFELASEIDRAVPYGTKRALAKKGYTKESFNKSCIHLARLLQAVVIKKLDGDIPIFEISYVDIEKAFPDLNDKMINKLLNFTAKAWDNLLKVCKTCPTACVTNKDMYSVMFDDESNYS
ncbi:hypothetical protein [Thiorhodovibrio frisius]|uniref:Uncharacterized protein n=1 Tax=Thiorhodovibrio frisius TaxID=631362 RepID=H8Z2S6_9GAMM|nr:hypothetical protein [Thiorhodovibrio frisius]EIC21662.1 hypothetical protein Thi970DRAFT_01882 [Thiorhodovibrio frisius]WPL21631.1 hypothetical protein Thiofri_01757 [Thiorhodovibrio frisius]